MKVDCRCKTCGKEFTEYPSRVAEGRGVFCSRTCSDSGRSKARIDDRFWTKVNKSGAVVRPDLGMCWEWIGARDPKGYGRFGIWGDGKTVSIPAHRVAFELTTRKLAEGECVLHKCDNPSCVNPLHLFAGSLLDNNSDMVQKNRHAFGERNGHAKMSVEKVKEIRSDYRFREVTAEMFAKRFGVSGSAVRYALYGWNWRQA
jgi:hypothetical protein